MQYPIYQTVYKNIDKNIYGLEKCASKRFSLFSDFSLIIF